MLRLVASIYRSENKNSSMGKKTAMDLPFEMQNPRERNERKCFSNFSKAWLLISSVWIFSLSSSLFGFETLETAFLSKCWPLRPPTRQVDLKVMSFNLRYDNQADKRHGHGWDTRLPLVVDQIAKHAPDIIGTQEGLLHQVNQLKQALGDKGMNYSVCGSARERFLGCFPCGEHCAIFSSELLQNVAQDSFALSETPSCIGSRSWGSGCPRIATYAWFTFSNTGSEGPADPAGCVLFLNTHLDHVSQRARALSSELIVHVLEELEKAPPSCKHIGTIVSGDFNSVQRDQHGTPEPPFSIFRSHGFRDACSEFGARDCPFLTFHGYKPTSAIHAKCPVSLRRGMTHGHIDWILWRGSLKLVDFEVDTSLRDAMPPSDHFPIIATFRWQHKSKKASKCAHCRCEAQAKHVQCFWESLFPWDHFFLI